MDIPVLSHEGEPLAPPSPTVAGASSFSLITHSPSEIHLTPLPTPDPHAGRGQTGLLVDVEPAAPEEEEDEFPWVQVSTSTPPRGRQLRVPAPRESGPALEEGDGDGEYYDEFEDLAPQDPLIRPRRPTSYHRRSASSVRPSLYSRRSTSRTSRGSSLSPEARRVRKVELVLAYIAFMILGACILLAWNSEIVAGRYFKARLAGSVYEASFAAFVAMTFTVGNLVFLWLANSTQSGADLSKRIQHSILLLIGVIAFFIGSTRIDQIDPTIFFVLLISLTLALAASAAYVQNAVVALCSHFGPFFLTAVLCGQGAVGVAVAVAQFVAAYTALEALSPADGDFLPVPRFQTPFNRGNLDSPVPDPAILQSAFTFFVAVASFGAVCLFAHAVLIRLNLYHRLIRRIPKEELQELKEFGPTLGEIERKVRKLGLSMFWVFAVTLSVFPAIVSSIASVHDPSQGDTGGLGPTLSQPHLFVPIMFTVFALGDWIGRLLPQFKALTFTDWRWLMAASAARTLFIPLFLLCNFQGGRGDGPPLINSDIAFLFIVFLFSSSNGYISSLVFLASVVEPSLDEDEIEIAATCLAFYLTAGLAFGSLVGFPVHAAACACNPFTS